MKTNQEPQSQSEEPQCCAICFAVPASPLNVGQSQSQGQQAEGEEEGNKENINNSHASSTSITTVNHATGFAYLPCCGGAQGQREATTSTKICTSCILTLCEQSRKLKEAANSFRVNNGNVNADEIIMSNHVNVPTTPTTATAGTSTSMSTSTSMRVSPETSSTPHSHLHPMLQESCTIHCPRCRHRVSVRIDNEEYFNNGNGNGYVYITRTAPKAQPNVHVLTCPIIPMSMSMRNDQELVHVLHPFASSSSTARLELPRRARARAPLVPLEAPHAPRNGRRERPSIALRRQRQHQHRNQLLFRQSPLSPPTFVNLKRQESNASVSVEEEQEPQQAIVRTLSFWQ
jgi:hypothetical protein